MGAPTMGNTTGLSNAELIAMLTALRGLDGSVTWNAGSLVDGAGESKDITVTGAALGDFVVASLGVDIVDFTISAAVTATDTVTIRLQNETGGTVDLASTTAFVRVLPK